MSQQIKAIVDLKRDDDGTTWITMQASCGSIAMFNLSEITTGCKTRAALMHWADEQFNRVARPIGSVPAVIKVIGVTLAITYRIRAINPLTAEFYDATGTLDVMHATTAIGGPVPTDKGGEYVGHVRCVLIEHLPSGLSRIELPDGNVILVETRHLK